MLRYILIILLTCNFSINAADDKSSNNLFQFYPYKTKLKNSEITKIIGTPLPKPDVEINRDYKTIKDPKSSKILYNNDKTFSYLAKDILTMLPCAPTPETTKKKNIKRFDKISNNNLRRAVGSPDVASGHILYVKGYLRDVNCHPIANTHVTIWQANSKGFYNEKVKGTDDYDPYLQEAGFAITDNEGRFEFITIMPGSIDNQAPFINFYIDIPKEISFETQIFFPDHQLNNSDIKLKTLPIHARELLISSIAPVNVEDLDEGFFMVVNLVANVINRY